MAGFEHRQCELRDPVIEPQHYPELNFVTSVHSLMMPLLPQSCQLLYHVMRVCALAHFRVSGQNPRAREVHFVNGWMSYLWSGWMYCL